MNKMIIHCGHHKSGSILFRTVLRKICKHLNLSFCGTSGPEKKGIYTNYDVVLFANSTIDIAKITSAYTGTHMIRDPRDVIVSGYLYHAQCKEKWCINIPDETSTPIEFPQIPHSQYSRPDKWKLEYIHSLNGSSYQERINSLDQQDGIIFEMSNYGRWTIESMLGWHYSNQFIKEIKFEDAMKDFIGFFEQVFSHYGFPASMSCELLDLISSDNICSLSDKEIQENDHIHSRQTSKWREYFSPRHKTLFKNMFGDALIKLGYERDNNW